MTFSWKLLAGLALAAGVVTGCGDDDDVDQTTDTVEDTVEDVTEDVQEAARVAWASFETNAERLMDEARTGDNEAQEELLESCRDTLQELREADDPDADRLESVCDRIRDADDESAWDELRDEIEEIGEGR